MKPKEVAIPEAVRKFKTDGDREGEAPAEPHGARTCWGGGSPRGSPSQFFHTFSRVDGNKFRRPWETQGS